ncbi:MAG: Na+/H+ antiporter NhaA [Candidatus Thiodiazotropha sp. (ex Lucina aurantia)]|uniref:Na(+)/H(+) antiporter NhaA n=2 Tax=Candidatus Thiodiazotropha TaxID=1913444 RepID=A0A7Z0VII9_9GAMM|nr:Na+/H+ antiporter NhaA [Candidatus Thiodiazotropha endolucinida]MBT3016881.1 Na+/H+ antiporter NhaA [Candidatus Thiodiazotropha taylori]MBT3031549.1 Na+/H+ antiporter NhaA [Candidatus Thiodiazotropha sp. (ex Lucina pensylvanica)]MBT3040018.1 Na+/H+ antiporter NhaA [Candidatus Thiodiazotropha sp. (ex Codakia orbicularis)]MBV2105332.1 Na+/H+ antiporter NhaA [Candidatus Thiodiazotropha sp. (ex Lucina aurantia)]MBT3025464.1 Na+/H+ antiporter NhaA [Candidatus Thiodiazotropha taylori]
MEKEREYSSEISKWLQDFMRQDSSSGILLIFAAILAMILENSPLSWFYDALLDTPVEIRIGELQLAKPLLLWINDGLMAVFFMLIGLEVKREFLEGELSRLDQIILPGLGAIGGMLVPAAIYYWLNQSDPVALNGWAIPAATDIAFALGVISLLGKRVPVSLRVFLMALAIFDDLGAIIIIAIFYTADLSFASLIIALVSIVVLFVLNMLHVSRVSAYVMVGVILWVAVLKSGVHATLAGVIIGLMIPIKDPKNSDRSPLREVEHGLHQWVALLIVPLFAFSNAGVSLSGLTFDALLEPIPLGIAAGLFVGKQIGIMLFCGVAIMLGFAKLPNGASWSGFYATTILCGIGFTMSLFIASLAFEQGGTSSIIMGDRLGILLGSGLSAVIGYLILRIFNPSNREASL